MLSGLFSDLSLNWVMRPSSPKLVTEASAQASSVCSGTADCTKSVDCAGSMPQAMRSPAMSRTRRAISDGSKAWVMAW